MLLQIVYVIVTRMTMFMIYIKWDQNQRKLATNNYTSVTKSKGDSEFKTQSTERPNTK